MKILIVTQVVDVHHPILGFFHRWIEEFASQTEKVTVICLQEGDHSLPDNVTVKSLGKEKGGNKFTYIAKFYSYIWKYRNDYDVVFVHMNPQYVVLGSILWCTMGKKIGLWYTHGHVSFMLRIANVFIDNAFTASEESYKIKTSKKQVTGHGIDTTVFKFIGTAKSIDLITVGRISPIKNLETLIEILNEVRKEVPATLTIVGSAIDESGRKYERKLHTKVQQLGLDNKVIFHGSASQEELPVLFNSAKVFVTTSQTGSLDKVVLEAMACGVPVVSMAKGSQSLPLNSGQVSDKTAFISEIKRILKLGQCRVYKHEEYVRESHGLRSLIQEKVKKNLAFS